MPRIARVVLPQVPYHVTHRGNRRTATFLDDVERRRYLDLVLEVAPGAGIRVWAYCLMLNHVHWILVPDHPDSLATGIGRAHGRYAAWFNHRHDWRGHLWSSRYFSTALDDRYLWFAARYVESNPMRAGLVANALDYPWSSAAANALGTHDRLLDPKRPFAKHPEDWATWLRAGGGSEARNDDLIRRNTLTGRPTGSEAFVRHVEDELGRALVVRRPGRPPRAPDSSMSQRALDFQSGK